MNRLDYAQLFIKMGIAVFPLVHRNKEPDVNGGWEQFMTTLPSTDLVHSWLASGWQNYAVVCGWNNLVVIDFDDMDYFNVWQLWAASQPEFIRFAVDGSFKVKTRRGVHVYISTLEPIENSKRIKKAGGIDIQAQRKYVVGPGCIHPTGHVYQPIDGEVTRLPILLGGIESILPFDLFPPITAEHETGSMEPVQIQSLAGEYDPFEAASRSDLQADFITQVKNRVRIEDFFPDRAKTSVDGRWYSARCPFHDDHKPSFWIDARRQICGCQVCGMKPMDAINLYSRMHNMPESQAVSALAQEVGVWG